MLTSELSEADVSGLRASKESLWNYIHHSCQWGTGIRWGEYVLSSCSARAIFGYLPRYGATIINHRLRLVILL